MRYYYKGVARDNFGSVVVGATITPYLAGTTTPVSIYSASSGGSPAFYTTTNSDGSFSFYLDRADYSNDQLFKLVISKTGFTSTTWDNIPIIGSSDSFLVEQVFGSG